MLGEQRFLQKVSWETGETGRMTKNLDKNREERKNRENTKKTCHKAGTMERRKFKKWDKE